MKNWIKNYVAWIKQNLNSCHFIWVRISKEIKVGKITLTAKQKNRTKQNNVQIPAAFSHHQSVINNEIQKVNPKLNETKDFGRNRRSDSFALD